MINSTLLHQTSIYYDYYKHNVDLPSALVTIRASDNLRIITRYLNYANLRKKILPKRTLFPKIGKVFIPKLIYNLNITALIHSILMDMPVSSNLYIQNIKKALSNINSFIFGLDLS